MKRVTLSHGNGNSPSAVYWTDRTSKSEAVSQHLSTPKLKSRFHSGQRWGTFHTTRLGSAGSIKDLLGCNLGKQRKRNYCLIKRGEKNVPVSFSLVWSLICRLWFKLRIKSPWGPEPTCSPYPFVQTGTKDNRKRLEPGVPWDPNLASNFFFFFYIPSLPLTFCTPLSSPISSLWLFLFFFPFPPLKISVVLQYHIVKESFVQPWWKDYFQTKALALWNSDNK